MAVKPGYKQTEVGVIPEDWAITTLGEFISLRRGHDLTERERRQGEIPVMGSAGQNGFHDTFLVKGPGVVLGRSGASFGQAHLCEVDFWPHNTALYVTDFHANNPRFVFYFLKSIDFSRHNSGGAQQSLNRNFIAPILVAIPPLREQQAIAEALSDVDGLISALDALIAKKRAIKQGAMQELLTGQRRLPGFAGEWETTTVEQIADVTTGDKDTKDKVDDGIYPFFVRSQVVERINSFSFDGEAVLTAGDGVGVGKVFHYINGKFDFHQRVYRISNFRDYDGRFFFSYFSNYFFREATKYNAKNSVDSVRREMITGMTVPLPSLPEQSAIAQILADMDAELAALVQKRDKTVALKQGMMQELLTGAVRLG